MARMAAARRCEFQPVSGPVLCGCINADFSGIYSDLNIKTKSSGLMFIFSSLFSPISVPSAKQTWRGRIFPTCVSYVSYAQLIRGEPISSAGSVRSHGRAQLLDRTAVATMTASTGTCNCCRHANPSTCRRWRASPAAPLSDSVLHVA